MKSLVDTEQKLSFYRAVGPTTNKRSNNNNYSLTGISNHNSVNLTSN
jgi:hypothetical protein